MHIRWRDCRIRHSPEFRLIYREGKRFFSRNVMLLAQPNTLEHARLGITLAKKKIKSAAARNRIKRQLRELFRSEVNELPRVDIVIHWRSAQPIINFDTLKTEFKNLCIQLVAHYRKSA